MAIRAYHFRDAVDLEIGGDHLAGDAHFQSMTYLVQIGNGATGVAQRRAGGTTTFGRQVGAIGAAQSRAGTASLHGPEIGATGPAHSFSGTAKG